MCAPYDMHKTRDTLWIGTDKGYLYQWSIKHQKAIKKFPRMHQSMVSSLNTDPNGRNLLITEDSGRARLLSAKTHRTLKDFTAHASNISGGLTPNNLYFFTADQAGILKQWSTCNYKLLKNYGYLHQQGISSIQITENSQSLFLGSHDGCLKQISIPRKKIIKDYFKIHQGGIYSMCGTPDSQI